MFADATWHLSTRQQHGVVHAHASRRNTTNGKNFAQFVTFCNLAAVPLTHVPGEVVMGCRRCLDAGAPHRLAS